LHPSRKTIKRQLPAWLNELRPELLRPVVLIYKAGILSMEPFRHWRILVNGKSLSEEQRRWWKKETASWL